MHLKASNCYKYSDVTLTPHHGRWLSCQQLASSGVHVLLVSLLVDQLFGLFLIFFGRPIFFWLTKNKFGRPKKKKSVDHNSGVHVLLVSLFGIPIVRLISHFFGRPNFFLVYQIFFWYTKYFFWSSKFFFWSTKFFFWSTKFLFGIPKSFFGIPNFVLVYQNFFWSTKKIRN